MCAGAYCNEGAGRRSRNHSKTPDLAENQILQLLRRNAAPPVAFGRERSGERARRRSRRRGMEDGRVTPNVGIFRRTRRETPTLRRKVPTRLPREPDAGAYLPQARRAPSRAQVMRCDRMSHHVRHP
jgi:hypothetical protein